MYGLMTGGERSFDMCMAPSKKESSMLMLSRPCFPPRSCACTLAWEFRKQRRRVASSPVASALKRSITPLMPPCSEPLRWGERGGVAYGAASPTPISPDPIPARRHPTHPDLIRPHPRPSLPTPTRPHPTPSPPDPTPTRPHTTYLYARALTIPSHQAVKASSRCTPSFRTLTVSDTCHIW